MKEIISTRSVTVTPIPNEVAFYTVFDEENGKKIRCAYCIVMVTVLEKVQHVIVPGQAPERSTRAQILHIATIERMRRKGYARNLMDALKEHFDVIYGEPVTSEMKKLLMNTGFVRVEDKELFKWEKK